ncbi:linker for activation of T-cells family member 2 isoform X1 [Lontra canadensis]|uniref:linker for activation of T-cells family member 2 isoform X1 n=2 Tax=Lontra canadensis TaxID=76717 RepID=UPI0013F33E5F|nr:linker for activation of T-cells family member 2 isoform X1 [Lontra canadensis]XP_032728309.1 linker for activation of T-cells family member 2 isoform X1 [Lontra canadensis]
MVLTKALPDMWPGVDMNVESELLWPGVALLLLLGTVASLCVRCSRPAVKKSEKIYEQRSPEEDQQNFAVARTYSLVRQAWPGALVDMDSDVALTRKDKLLRFSPSLEDSESSRYQNFSKGTRLGPRSGPDAAHTDPISMDYYNWGQFWKPQEDDDNEDANSYENVLICTQKEPDSGDEGSEDYQNSASIRQWRESRRAVERAPREEPLTLAGSPDEDGDDPDYVNQSVAATEA